MNSFQKDGIILKKQKVQFKEGESVYDVLVKVCKENNIHMESSWTPMYNSAYIEGINNLYEFVLRFSFGFGCTKSMNGFQTTAVHDMYSRTAMMWSGATLVT